MYIVPRQTWECFCGRLRRNTVEHICLTPLFVEYCLSWTRRGVSAETQSPGNIFPKPSPLEGMRTCLPCLSKFRTHMHSKCGIFLVDDEMALPRGFFTKKNAYNEGIPTWIIEFGGHPRMLPPTPLNRHATLPEMPVLGRFLAVYSSKNMYHHNFLCWNSKYTFFSMLVVSLANSITIVYCEVLC